MNPSILRTCNDRSSVAWRPLVCTCLRTCPGIINLLFCFTLQIKIRFLLIEKKNTYHTRWYMFNDNSKNIKRFVLFFVFNPLTTNMSQKKEECIPGDCTIIKVTDYAIFLQNHFQISGSDLIEDKWTYQRKSVIPGDLSRILNHINRLYNLPMNEQ